MYPVAQFYLLFFTFFGIFVCTEEDAGKKIIYGAGRRFKKRSKIQPESS